MQNFRNAELRIKNAELRMCRMQNVECRVKNWILIFKIKKTTGLNIIKKNE
jgi:hypothetical protein